MTNPDASPAARWRHVVRLAVFAAFLVGLFYLVAITRVIDVEDVRRTVAATGPAAPLAYVVVSAVLGAVFVPGPILAAGSGMLFGARARHLRDAGRDGWHRDNRQPRGRAGRPRQRTRAARHGTGRPSRRNDRPRRIVGGRRAAFRPRHLRRAGVLCVRRVRSSVVADGRRSVHRICAARVRLHRAWRVDRRSVGTVGVHSNRRVVRDRHRRCLRRTEWISTMAQSRQPARRLPLIRTGCCSPATWPLPGAVRSAGRSPRGCVRLA